MDHILKDSENIDVKLEQIFQFISEGNMILFLGAGASITNKKYLSQQIIEYYESQINQYFGISDITQFLDILEASEDFDRRAFDNYVFELLHMLQPDEIHKTIVNIPWQKIITTNFDLLIEKAQDLDNKKDKLFEYIPIRSKQELNNFNLRSEIQYIKLNGCMSDKSSYPFIFSSNDFRNSNKYHKMVLRNLRSATHKTYFLSVGYSFNDKFGEKFFEILESQDYRERKWMFRIDPQVNNAILPYYKSKRVCIIQMTADEFFNRYKLWEEIYYADKQKKFPGLVIKDNEARKISIPNRVAYNFRNSLEQLSNTYRGQYITKKDFYYGEEPDYGVINRNYDIEKSLVLKKLKKKIFQNVSKSTSSLIPIHFLTGTFGTGKSTLGYRLIKEITNSNEISAISFEVLEIDLHLTRNLAGLLESINVEYIILYFDNAESHSFFKSIMVLRSALSSRQISNSKILLIVPIRENILKVHLRRLDYKNYYEYNIDSKLELNEIDRLVTNLKECDIIDYRDQIQKRKIIETIKYKYNGDSFISLTEFVTNGKHLLILRDAFQQLSKDCQTAFIYTALLHRFKILMPASLLRKLISKPWDEFTEEVLKGDGKGILIQEEKIKKGYAPDLYLRTKHPIIAEKLISELVKSIDKKYNYYRIIFSNLLTGDQYVILVNDILKAISKSAEFSHEKIDKLYDLAYRELQDEPYFILHYANNLQRRNSKRELQRALDLLVESESQLERKSDRFIHRRASIHFSLTRVFYKEEKKELNLTLKHLNEAKELFEIKQLMDPCSSFSYINYIELLIWELENVVLEKDDELIAKIKIEGNIEQALTSITEGVNHILDLQKKYIAKNRYETSKVNYLDELNEMYEDPVLRPLACILKHNYWKETDNISECQNTIDEMFEYLDNIEVALFLFKFYSDKLNYKEHRLKFYQIITKVNKIEDIKPLHFQYYMFVAESYSFNFFKAFSNLKKIEREFLNINPDFELIWKETESEENKIFDGKVIEYKRRFLAFKPYEIQRSIFFITRLPKEIKINDNVKCILHFRLNGIRAELIEPQIE